MSANRPQQFNDVEAMRAYAREARAEDLTIALVPTMGYLHQGHLALVRRARSLADRVVVSIYVNPTQFGPGEDLQAYPRAVESDLDKLGELGVQAVFLPSDATMYPTGYATYVTVEGLTEGLCGASRPVHFRGVTTIVTKLFLAVEPDFAVFGEKDYQQLAVIRRMTADLGIPIEIVGVPIVREPDGLAMSSRNAYLTADERDSATALFRALSAVRSAYRAGAREGAELLDLAKGIIEAEPPLQIDYVALIDPDDLHLLVTESNRQLPERVHMAVAVFAGSARLIDNLRISGPDSAQEGVK